MEGKTRTNYKPRTKWWNLKDKTLAFLKDKQIKEGKWKVTENANYMLNDMVRHIKRVAKDIIRKSKGNRQSDKESWWWKEYLQTTIKAKRISCKNLQNYKNKEKVKKYERAENEAKKALSEVNIKHVTTSIS